jgi:hypothetical protein
MICANYLKRKLFCQEIPQIGIYITLSQEGFGSLKAMNDIKVPAVVFNLGVNLLNKRQRGQAW